MPVLNSLAVVLSVLAATATFQRGDCMDGSFVAGATRLQRANLPDRPVSGIDAGDSCLDDDPAKCTQRDVLDPDRMWIAGARSAGWVCVTDGYTAAWTEEVNLKFGKLPPLPASEWLGHWTENENEILIRRTKDGRLQVSGAAIWQAGPDALPHTGDFDFTGKPDGRLFELGEPACITEGKGCVDCVVRMLRVEDVMLVADNGHCGGMNVRFTGAYTK